MSKYKIQNKNNLVEKWQTDLDRLNDRYESLKNDTSKDNSIEIASVLDDIEMLENIVNDMNLEVLDDSNYSYGKYL